MRQIHSSVYFNLDTLEIAGRKTRHSLNIDCSEFIHAYNFDLLVLYQII